MLSDKKKIKISKIIIGFLVILLIGQEYVSASRQLGSFFSPVIIVLIGTILLLPTWLIGAGFNPMEFKLKSIKGIKFFIVSLVVFVVVVFFALLSYVVPDDFKLVNGIRIPMNICVNETERIIPEKEERRKYCLCLAEKVTSSSSLKGKYLSKLKKGKLIEIFKDLQKEGKSEALGLESCIGKVEMKWTDNIANIMKVNCTEELEGTDFEQTNDPEIYCGCLIDAFKKYPLSKIMEEDFRESELGLSIESNCTEKSKK